jgi:DNA-binding transcriptional MocR family regulator
MCRTGGHDPDDRAHRRVNFHTVNKAYDQLRAEGLLRLNRRSGAVIVRDSGSGPPLDGVAEAWSTRRALPAIAVTLATVVVGVARYPALRDQIATRRVGGDPVRPGPPGGLLAAAPILTACLMLVTT